MGEARIHPHGGPKKLTDAQQIAADALVARGIYVYAEKVQGASIVSAWLRYLQTGDAEKITPALYEFIHMKCGYIAHFNLHGFRHVYSDAADMLAGELYPSVWEEDGTGGPVEHSASVYTDGMSDQDVYAEMVKIAVAARPIVLARSQAETETAELTAARQIAAKYGYELMPA